VPGSGPGALRLEKWQGAGNAYLLVEGDRLASPLDPRTVGLLCDARRGIGADGVLVLDHPSDPAAADARMTILNPDGSTSEACGNGTRMVVRYLAERLGRDAARVETAAGVLSGHVHADGTVTSTMADATLDGPAYRPDGEPFPFRHRFVSIGNPHVVITVDDPAAFPLAEQGPLLERHPWFPERTNVEVVRPVDRHTLDLRVWERGVGETWACGSGACAAAWPPSSTAAPSRPSTCVCPAGRCASTSATTSTGGGQSA
jgi:diaminopimelate epimerase